MKCIKFELLGDPISTNDLYKIGRKGMYMTEEGKEMKYDYWISAKNQYNRKPFAEDISIKIKLYFKTNPRHDIDNYNKILLDSLTGVAYKDDSQITKMTVEKYKVVDNARIEIEVCGII